MHQPVMQITRTEWKGQEMAQATSPEMIPAGRLDAATGQTVSALVAQYDEVEGVCEKAIGLQEQLARTIYAQRTEDLCTGATLPISAVAFGEFRHMHDLARRVVPEGLPNASRRFVMKARSPGLVEIEDLEETIRLARCRMGILEQDILNLTPASAQDAAVKLKFMSSLMLDGGNLDVDFFAYLVEECAFVIASHLAGA
jgi:hypothetical protein